MSMLEVTGKGQAQDIPGTKSASNAAANHQITFNHQQTHWVGDLFPCNAQNICVETFSETGLPPLPF